MNGLVYEDDGVVHGLLIKDGQIIINPVISTYIVHLAAGKVDKKFLFFKKYYF